MLEEAQAHAAQQVNVRAVETRLRQIGRRLREAAAGTALLRAAAELGLLLAWSLWFSRVYLNIDPKVWPIGGDFPLTIQPHYIWPYLRDCGSCVFWNGLINGGYPSFAESVAAILHPVTIASTLIWGVINGAKFTLVLSFFLAGLAQWWLSKVMRLGLVPRLWASAMAVVSGHLAGRMEMGLVAMVFSTAAASLVFAPALRLAETRHRRDAVVLGVMFGLALLSGQGYIQVALLIALITIALVNSLGAPLQLKPVWKEYRFAGVLAVLLAASFIVPFMHFLPSFSKFADTAFANGQPLGYVPLNLVISDYDLYRTELLGKIGFPAMYINYVGWVPVLLALVLLRQVQRKDLRRLLSLLLPIALIFALSSSTVLEQLGKLFPTAVANVRYPSLMAGLAVPLILGLAAWGLDRLLKMDAPKLALEVGTSLALRTRLTIPMLIVALPLSVKSAYEFSHDLLKTAPAPPKGAELVKLLTTETTQWVAPPIEHFWMPPLLENGLKVTQIYRPASFKDREPPPAQVQYFQGPVEAAAGEHLGTVGPFEFARLPQNEYAFVEVGAQRIACSADARLGFIGVECASERAGVLTVHENAWSGWKAYVDGQPAGLSPGRWLTVDLPAGSHQVEFRYRPWDVPLGLALTGLGVLLATWSWARSPRPPHGEPKQP